MGTAGPYKPFRTNDINLNSVQAAVREFADQLELARRGVIGYPSETISKGLQLGEQAIVRYNGPAANLLLPSAMKLGRGRGQIIVICHEGTGALTVTPTQAPGATKPDVLTSPVSLVSGQVATLVSDGYSTWLPLLGSTGPGAGVYGPWVKTVTLDAQGRVTAVVVGTPVASLKAESGGTPLTGDLEIDGISGIATSVVGSAIKLANTLITGFTGGQTVLGGTAAGETLSLKPTGSGTPAVLKLAAKILSWASAAFTVSPGEEAVAMVTAGESGNPNRAVVALQGSVTGSSIFGYLRFYHQTNDVAEVQCIRDGADDAGKFSIQTKPTGGALTERISVSSTGAAVVTGTAEFQKVVWQRRGAALTAGSSMTLGTDGNTFDITGTPLTTVNYVGSTAVWHAGSIVVFTFTIATNLTHNAGGAPANFVPLLLAGSASRGVVPGARLVFLFDSTAFIELAATVP